jgi:hypothetical protein
MLPPREWPKTIILFGTFRGSSLYASIPRVFSIVRSADSAEGAIASLTGLRSNSVKTAEAVPMASPIKGSFRDSQVSSVRAPLHPM